MKNKSIISIITALATATALAILPNSCANTSSPPSGGLKDTLPPVLIKLVPPQNDTNFPRVKGKVAFTFDEYTVIKTANDIFVSPPMKTKPKTKVSGKSIVVSFPDTLKENQTYTLDLGNALVDNNEGNVFPRMVYTFSTGGEIDSMFITGTVMDAEKLLPVKGALVSLYTDMGDSAIFNNLPVAATRTDDWGYFVIRNIKPCEYRLYTISDDNNNNLYDPASESVGFISRMIRPDSVMRRNSYSLGTFDIKDTLACKKRESEYNVLMFTEENSREKIVNSGRVSPWEVFIKFLSPNPKIDTIHFSGIRDSKLIKQFNEKNDSLTIYLNEQGYIPDTLFAQIRYGKTDSTGDISPFTEDLKLFMERAAAMKMQKQKDTAMGVTITAPPDMVEQTGFVLDFSMPLLKSQFDSIIYISKDPRGKEKREKFKIEQDEHNVCRYTIRPLKDLQKGFDYTITLRKGTFTSLEGLPNDSLSVTVTLPNDDDLSSITTVMTNVDKRYIVDLVNENREKVFRTYKIDAPAILKFPYLKAGKYSIRITEDGNRNGIIDTGNLLEHRQPEKVMLYELPGSIPETAVIDLKEKTDLEQDIDVGKMFK
ncbi:MAG: Ig-like domain-containing protein [Bacteroidales bacterium]|jgi:hypothetical protein|nr:Ig-like domain-containing protein [Bacteroidales bacterium]MCI2121160.1 Ig-like domain-containing protein [Bacteroidales bacterium]MCI2144749.1 Ig-like domain-containing protein [Bacteroidales bacterium]